MTTMVVPDGRGTSWVRLCIFGEEATRARNRSFFPVSAALLRNIMHIIRGPHSHVSLSLSFSLSWISHAMVVGDARWMVMDLSLVHVWWCSGRRRSRGSPQLLQRGHQWFLQGGSTTQPALTDPSRLATCMGLQREQARLRKLSYGFAFYTL